MKNYFNLYLLLTFLFYFNIILGQQSDIKIIELVSYNQIGSYTEPVEGVYVNNWSAFKVNSREMVIMSEGKTKEIRAFITFNCENKKYVLYASTNFGYNITEEKFKVLVPEKVIDMSREIYCQENRLIPMSMKL